MIEMCCQHFQWGSELLCSWSKLVGCCLRTSQNTRIESSSHRDPNCFEVKRLVHRRLYHCVQYLRVRVEQKTLVLHKTFFLMYSFHQFSSFFKYEYSIIFLDNLSHFCSDLPSIGSMRPDHHLSAARLPLGLRPDVMITETTPGTECHQNILAYRNDRKWWRQIKNDQFAVEEFWSIWSAHCKQHDVRHSGLMLTGVAQLWEVLSGWKNMNFAARLVTGEIDVNKHGPRPRGKSCSSDRSKSAWRRAVRFAMVPLIWAWHDTPVYSGTCVAMCAVLTDCQVLVPLLMMGRSQEICCLVHPFGTNTEGDLLETPATVLSPRHDARRTLVSSIPDLSNFCRLTNLVVSPMLYPLNDLERPKARSDPGVETNSPKDELLQRISGRLLSVVWPAR